MPMTMTMTSLLLMLLGCPKRPVVPLVIDWGETPHLPAPTAGSYALVPERPADRAVASMMTGHQWDASLSGAAAGIALKILAKEGTLTVPELRDAAFKAGWPYPITSAQVWSGQPGGPPPPGVEDWVHSRPPDASLGFVRARGPTDEVWVGLSSKPRIDIGVIPRQLPRGGTLTVPAVPGADVWVADPYGRLDHGPLDVPFTRTAEVEGEWLIEIRDASGTAASFPIYVGMVAPDLGLLVPGQPPADWQEADDLTVELLADLRAAYGARMYESDLMLEAVAQAAATNPDLDTRAIAPQVGVEPGNLWRWECQATTVEGCLDAILWDVRARPGLLAERALYSRYVELNTKGVRIVLVVAAV
jgi:hypothetical protein